MFDTPLTSHGSKCDIKAQAAATFTAPQADTKKCHFFKLPPELRVIIYTDVLSPIDLFQDRNLHPRIIRPPLLNTCKTIQDESVQVYTYRLGMISTDILLAAAQTFVECSELVRTVKATENDSHAALVITASILKHLGKIANYLHASLTLVEREKVRLQQAFGTTKAMMSVEIIERADSDLRQAIETLRDEVGC